MKKLCILTIMGLISSQAIAHDVVARAQQTGGFAGYNTIINDLHAVRLFNGRDYPVSVTYHYRLCIDSVKNCVQVDRPVTLRAHGGEQPGHWTNQESLRIDNVFKYAGNYQIQTTTWIDGDGAKTTTDYNVLTIR